MHILKNNQFFKSKVGSKFVPLNQKKLSPPSAFRELTSLAIIIFKLLNRWFIFSFQNNIYCERILIWQIYLLCCFFFCILYSKLFSNLYFLFYLFCIWKYCAETMFTINSIIPTQVSSGHRPIIGATQPNSKMEQLQVTQ